LPEKYQDYVVVHELCHLKEFNHSKRFWDLVGEAIPDFKKIRREIRNL
jgi:predicted metal-dependent hydrolase